MMSRAHKILSFVTAATLGTGVAAAAPGGKPTTTKPAAAPATAAATTAAPAPTPADPATPLLAANGRPACGNTLTKSGRDDASSYRRTEMAAALKSLAKLAETNALADADNLARRDQLIASIRDGLEQIEVCEIPPPPPPVVKVPAPRARHARR